jgi:hypothetical protein
MEEFGFSAGYKKNFMSIGKLIALDDLALHVSVLILIKIASK